MCKKEKKMKKILRGMMMINLMFTLFFFFFATMFTPVISRKILNLLSVLLAIKHLQTDTTNDNFISIT